MDNRLPKSAAHARAAWAACAVLTLVPPAAIADWNLSASTVVRHDNNVGGTEDHDDRVADFSTAAKLSLFDVLQLGRSYTVALGADVGGEFYDRLVGLRSGSVDAQMSIRRKWGVGAFAPWIRATLSPGRANFDAGYRDAAIYRAEVEFGRRLDARWNLWSEFAFDRRLATPVAVHGAALSTDVFSTHGRSMRASVQYTLRERVIFTVGALLRHGDVVATMYPAIYTYLDARAAVADPTFGPDEIAYRLFGTTYAVRVGMDYSLTAHCLIGAGYERAETHAAGGNDYAKSIPELTWKYRF